MIAPPLGGNGLTIDNPAGVTLDSGIPQPIVTRRVNLVRGTLHGSTHSFDCCLTLPLFHELTFEQQDEVVSALSCQLSEAAR